MTAVDNGVDTWATPADYADLFRTYHPYIVSLLRRAGIPVEHLDDAAGEVLLRCMERDILTQFDPNLFYIYNGRIGQAKFKSFLHNYTSFASRGLRDKYQRIATREQLTLDTGTDEGVRWLEELLVDGHEEAVLDTVDGDRWIADLRAYLKTVPRRSQYDTCDLVAFFDAIAAEVNRTGTCTMGALKEVFGVSSTAIYTWRRRLQFHIAAYLGEQT